MIRVRVVIGRYTPTRLMTITTQLYYNSAGYAWKTVYPNGDTIQYTSFDNLGNPTSRTDGRSVVTNYTYSDVENKLTDVAYPASTSLNVHIGYDSYGRTTSVSDGSGSHAFAYDDADNKTTDTTTYTGLAARTLTIGYNPDGSRSSLTLPDSTSFSYSYDGAGRAVGLSNPSGQSWSWSYADNNWLTQQNANGQIITTPTRDARGFITDLENQRNDMLHTTLSDYGIGFASNLTVGSMTASIPGAPSSFSGTNSYTHDTKLQLTQESSTRAGSYTNNQAYDTAGNSTTFKGSTNTFNNANQNTAYTHDGNGNPTTYKGTTLTFDAENRMTAYGSVLTAGYRADGLRAWKTTSAGTTYYLYDGDHPVEEMDGSGSKTAVMTFGPDGVLARTTSTRTLLYTFDALGQMAQQMEVSSGNIVASYLFDAWGTRAYSSSDTAAINDPYSGYGANAGYITDWETGLQLLGHRYYDPATGRFLNRDPIGMIGGINVYGYVSNSPLHLNDKTGFGPVEYDPSEGLAGLVGCLMSLIALLPPVVMPPSLGAALGFLACAAAVNCWLGRWSAMASYEGPEAACLAGALSSLFSQIWDNICQQISGCGMPQWFQDPVCFFISAVLGVIAGCAAGYFWGPFFSGWVGLITSLGLFVICADINSRWGPGHGGIPKRQPWRPPTAGRYD